MPVTLFFCYAREDEALLNKLKRHLRPLQRQELLAVWHDRDIRPGSPWEQEIDQHLRTAQIILLLVSPDFMDSDYCYGIEMKQALERHARGEAKVIPVILRPTYWQTSPLAPLQALPTDGKPITSALWHDQDAALYDVVEGISHVVEQLVQMPSPLPAVAEATQQQESKQHEHLQSKGSTHAESDSEAFKTSEEQRTSLSSKEISKNLEEKGSIPHISANDGTSFSLSDPIPSIMPANTLHPFTSSPDSSTPPPNPESLPRVDTASAFPHQEVVMVEHQTDKERQRKGVSSVSQRAATHSTQAIPQAAKGTLLPQPTRSSGSLPSSIATSSSLDFFRRILSRRTLIIGCLVVLLISSVLLLPGLIKLPTLPLKKGTPVRASVDVTATGAARAYGVRVTASGIMLGFDAAHTGWNPDEKILSTQNVKRLILLWSFANGGGDGIESSPAVANGLVYIGSSDHHLYAFDASCRKQCQPLWSFATSDGIGSPPAVANGLVYVNGNGSLYVFGIPS